MNRVENNVFDSFIGPGDFGYYKKLFLQVCYQLGEDGNGIIRQHNVGLPSVPNFRVLADRDFTKTLRVLVAIYHAMDGTPYSQKILSHKIQKTLDMSSVDLGVKWTDGLFYPSGEKLLDKELIDSVLQVLDGYPNENKDIKLALDNYEGKRLEGVVENCYLAVEGLSRKLLKNGKTLENNKVELLQSLSVSKHWSGIFGNYLMYANEYRRHAGENRHDLNPVEVEAFLYLTCLFIRALLQLFEDKETPASAPNLKL